MGKKKKKQTLDEVIAEEKVLADAKVELETELGQLPIQGTETQPDAVDIDDLEDAKPEEDGPQVLAVVEPNPLAGDGPQLVDSVEDVKPGEHLHINPDDPVVILREDVLKDNNLADVQWEGGKAPEAPEDAPESQEPPEGGEEDGTDELEGDDTPEEVEPPKRTINPRNTRR